MQFQIIHHNILKMNDLFFSLSVTTPVGIILTHDSPRSNEMSWKINVRFEESILTMMANKDDSARASP